MSLALVVAAKDLRQRLRDRSALVVSIVAPLVLAAIISAAIGGNFTSFRATFAVADDDGGPLAKAFVDGVLRSPSLTKVVHVRVVSSAAEAKRITRRDVDAAFLIPAGFSAAITSAQPAHFQVVRSRDRLIGGQLATSLAQGFAARVEATQLAVRTAVASGARADPAALARAATATPPQITLNNTSSGGRELSPASYFGPAMALFFLFFTVGLGARGLLAERGTGTLGRLRAAPIRGRTIVTGKTLATFALGMASMLTLIVASSALLGARWGHPLVVLGLVTSAVLAAMGIIILVMSLARTEEQAAGYASVAAIALALLGGNFVPISQAPALLRKLTLLTPNGWALRAFTDLGTGARSLSTVATAILVCLAFAAVTGGIGLARATTVLAE